MPFIEFIREIFTEADSPYELTEIVERLQTYWNPGVSEDAVYRALVWLREQPSTAELVKPENPGAAPLHYGCEGARRIARKIATRTPLTSPFYSVLEQNDDPFSAFKKAAIEARLSRDSRAKTA